MSDAARILGKTPGALRRLFERETRLSRCSRLVQFDGVRGVRNARGTWTVFLSDAWDCDGAKASFGSHWSWQRGVYASRRAR